MIKSLTWLLLSFSPFPLGHSNTELRSNLTEYDFKSNKLDIRTHTVVRPLVPDGTLGPAAIGETVLAKAERRARRLQHHDGYPGIKSPLSHLDNRHFLKKNKVLSTCVNRNSSSNSRRRRHTQRGGSIPGGYLRRSHGKQQ